MIELAVGAIVLCAAMVGVALVGRVVDRDSDPADRFASGLLVSVAIGAFVVLAYFVGVVVLEVL